MVKKEFLSFFWCKEVLSIEQGTGLERGKSCPRAMRSDRSWTSLSGGLRNLCVLEARPPGPWRAS